MAVTTVYCMYCNSTKVNKHGFQSGKQRYRCQESGCSRSFLLDYKNRWLVRFREDTNSRYVLHINVI